METPLSPASVGRDRDVPARIPLSDTGLLPLLFAVAMAALGLAGLFLASRADSDYVETAGLSFAGLSLWLLYRYFTRPR